MLSVVIPALNECAAIIPVIDEARRVLMEAAIVPFEIIVVDDGSTDGTGNLAAQAGAAVIRHPHSVGYGRSLKDGILAAQHEVVAITDADGTYPIHDLPKLYALWLQGYDMVVGARTGPRYRNSFLRLLLRFIVEWTAGRPIPDINSGLRVFSRQLTIGFMDRLCDTFSFTTSLTLAYMMNSKFVGYCEIDYYERVGKTRVRLFRDAMKTMQFIIEAAVYYNPLRIFFLFSALCLACAVVSLTLGLITTRATFFALGVGGTLLAIGVMSLGLVCVLLKQIMDHGRPRRATPEELATAGEDRGRLLPMRRSA